MDYISVVGNDGVTRQFSKLIMGTDHLAQSDWVTDGQPAPSKEAIFEILDEAVRNGMNVIDTSPIYAGGIEHIVGEWLQSRKDQIKSDSFYLHPKLNPDRKIYVFSKAGFPQDLFWSKHLDGQTYSKELIAELKEKNILAKDALSNSQVELNNVPPGSYASRLFGSKDQVKIRIQDELQHIVGNLGESLTVLYMHRDDFDSVNFEVTPRDQNKVEIILSALSDPEISNHFTLLGLSNWTDDRVMDSLKVSNQNQGLIKPIFNSPYFSLFEMSERSIHARGIQIKHADLLKPEFQKGIFLAPYSPLGGFSILDKTDPIWENAKRAAYQKFVKGDPYWKNVYHSVFTDENAIRFGRAKEMAKEFSKKLNRMVTVDQIVNAYALSFSRIDFLTVGAITTEQLRRTVESLELSKLFSDQHRVKLYTVDKKELTDYINKMLCRSIYQPSL